MGLTFGATARDSSRTRGGIDDEKRAHVIVQRINISLIILIAILDYAGTQTCARPSAPVVTSFGDVPGRE